MQCIRLYEQYLRDTPELLMEIWRLRGRNLICYCVPQPCHGEVLMRIANAPDLADAIFEFLLGD
jgi:hypothetical protein